ncbi:MAG: general secretion pathway protein GspK, partial [Thermodesulfobacteriota bacterium]
SFPVGEGFVSISVQDERAKINLNALVNQSTNQVDFQVLTELTELFRFLDVDFNAANIFISSLINWLDQDIENSQNDQDPRGAAAAYYSSLEIPYRIKDGPLDSLDEIKMIQGMTQDFFTVAAPYLTIYPVNKQINFSTASKPVIMAGLKAAQVSAIEEQGENNTDTLKDDVAEEIADEIISRRSSEPVITRSELRMIVIDVDSTLRISAGLSGIVLNTGKSDIFSVNATGFTGEGESTSRTVQAVLFKTRESRSTIARVVSWKER